MKFWLHVLAAELFVTAPIFALHWPLGVVVGILVLFSVEVAHGLFDDIIEAFRE